MMTRADHARAAENAREQAAVCSRLARRYGDSKAGSDAKFWTLAAERHEAAAAELEE